MATTRKEEIKRLWNDAFKDSEEYLDMYFSRIYLDEQALTITDPNDGRLLSSLLLQPYSLWMQGAEIPITYIAGAATRRNARGRGLMSSLMLQALDRAVADGSMMCALIPSRDWLYFFFDHFGFATVFLTDVQRFTSLHAFNTEDTYSEVDDHYSTALYSAFSRFERQRRGGVLHTQRQFINMLDELALRAGGRFVAVSRADMPVAAMAWAEETDGVVHVMEVLGADDDARRGAMRCLRSYFPDKPFRFLAPPFDASVRHLHPRGMARIVNAGMCLQHLAAANPSWKCRLRISDDLLELNNRTFVVACGRCTVADPADDAPLDFDITIEVLTKIVFSSPAIGAILNFPSQRTCISLMPH